MDEYALNVLKLVASELRLLNGMTAAREMYGKSYFSLGIGEKIAVDQAVQGMVSGNFHAVTPEYFAGPEIKNPVHVGSDTIAPRFWCVPAAWFGEEDERRPPGPSASSARRNL